MLTHRHVWEVIKMLAKRVDPERFVSVATRMVLAATIGVTRALALTLSTAVLTTTLTTFSPLLSAVAGRRRPGG